jgi:hypothetical protein
MGGKAGTWGVAIENRDRGEKTVCDALLAIQMERSIGILCPPGAVYYVVVTRVLEPRCTDEDEYVYSCHFTVHMPRLHAAWEVPLAVALHERRTVIRRAPHCTARTMSRPWRSRGTSRETETRRAEAKAWCLVVCAHHRSATRARTYWLLVKASGLSGTALLA